MAKYKTGELVYINANGCDPKCGECTGTHAPLRGIVVKDRVYLLHDAKAHSVKVVAARLSRRRPKGAPLKDPV